MQPKISVIVVAYNEEKLLARCLESLARQDLDKSKFEVILVDNNSTDKTGQIGKDFGVTVYKYTDKQGCGPSRSFGALKANGSILAFTDPDCIVPTDWLTKIDKLLENPSIVGVGGKDIPDKRTFWTNTIFSFYNGFYLFHNAIGKGLVWGHNMAIKKDAYEAVNGFNVSLLSSDDWDLVLRLEKRFGKRSVLYTPDLQVISSVRKQETAQAFLPYALAGLKNYFDLVILGKAKALPLVNVR